MDPTAGLLLRQRVVVVLSFSFTRMVEIDLAAFQSAWSGLVITSVSFWEKAFEVVSSSAATMFPRSRAAFVGAVTRTISSTCRSFGSRVGDDVGLAAVLPEFASDHVTFDLDALIRCCTFDGHDVVTQHNGFGYMGVHCKEEPMLLYYISCLGNSMLRLLCVLHRCLICNPFCNAIRQVSRFLTTLGSPFCGVPLPTCLLCSLAKTLLRPFLVPVQKTWPINFVMRETRCRREGHDVFEKLSCSFSKSISERTWWRAALVCQSILFTRRGNFP
eukprot:s189_g19.t1